jgi:hypothetical protein
VLESGGKHGDSLNITVGVRNLDWKADSGFYLNGQHTKIRGFCDHNGERAFPCKMHTLVDDYVYGVSYRETWQISEGSACKYRTESSFTALSSYALSVVCLWAPFLPARLI